MGQQAPEGVAHGFQIKIGFNSAPTRKRFAYGFQDELQTHAPARAREAGAWISEIYTLSMRHRAPERGGA